MDTTEHSAATQATDTITALHSGLDPDVTVALSYLLRILT